MKIFMKPEQCAENTYSNDACNTLDIFWSC